MSIEALNAVAKSNLRPSGRKFVALALANFANTQSFCYPSVEQLAHFTGQGEKTVRDHLDALEEIGFLIRERQHRRDGTLGRYAYTLRLKNLPVANLASGEKRLEPAAKSATHNPQDKPSSNSLPSVGAEFESFWKLFPNKVGKRAAEQSFRNARKRVSQFDLMTGLSAYTSKLDDRPWCNPTTWLNQDRWLDSPAQPSKRILPNKSVNAAQILLNRRQQATGTAHDERSPGQHRVPPTQHIPKLPIG